MNLYDIVEYQGNPYRLIDLSLVVIEILGLFYWSSFSPKHYGNNMELLVSVWDNTENNGIIVIKPSENGF